MTKLKDAIGHNVVPLLFFVISAGLIIAADLELNRISSDVLERFFRNVFLVVALVIPIVAGLGLNFGIVLGAMAGQVGLLFVQNNAIGGVTGVMTAVACSIPIATILGYLTGLLFNRARGREMICGIILGFFSNGIYQFCFLILAGPVIPLRNEEILLPHGMGLRVTINLTTVERGLDGLLSIPLRFGGAWWGEIPVVTGAVILAMCAGVVVFLRTKLGQDLRAVGQDAHVAEVAGIRVDRARIIAIILSMVFAGIGQILFLQNMAVMNTFQSHEQVGFYAIAALLVGGATVTRVTIGNAIAGTILFHTMIVVVSLAGQKLMGSAQIGEYLREFVAYGIIGTTLALHAWRSQRRRPDAS